MSTLQFFLKKNKKKSRENVFYAPTKTLRDEDGEPLKWELKPLSTKMEQRIREECTREVPIKNNPRMFRPKLDVNAYGIKMLVESVVCPNLLNSELQDSYGVKNAEDLLLEMVDDPGEFAEFSAFVQQYNGFSTTDDEVDKVEQAKN